MKNGVSPILVLFLLLLAEIGHSGFINISTDNLGYKNNSQSGRNVYAALNDTAVIGPDNLGITQHHYFIKVEYRGGGAPSNSPVSNRSNINPNNFVVLQSDLHEVIQNNSFSITKTIPVINSSGNLTTISMTYNYTNVTYNDTPTGVAVSSGDTKYYMLIVNTSNMQSGVYNVTFNITPGLSITVDPDVSACGSLAAAGVYTITANLFTTGNCLTVDASNILINGSGFAIAGDRGGTDYGISASGKLNITIVNLSLVNFSSGIYFSGTNNSAIKNVTSWNNSGNGILLYITENNTIRNFSSYNNSLDGVRIWIGKNISVNESILYNNTGNGIAFNQSDNIRISNNTISHIYNDGIGLSANADNSTVTNNTIFNITNDGIGFGNNRNVSFVANIIYNATRDGIRIDETNGNANNITVAETKIYAIGGRGILLTNNPGFNITLYNSTIYNTTSNNILFAAGSGINISNNTLYECPDYCIRMDTSNSTAANNTIRDASDGILVIGGSSYNNTVFWNIVRNTSIAYAISGGASNNSFYNNTAINASDTGFKILLESQSENNTLFANTVYDSSTAFYIAANNNTFFNNSAYNSTAGFTIERAQLNNLTGNRAFNNTNRGFSIVDTGGNNTLNDNLAYNNSIYGFLIQGHGNNLTNNTAISNQGIGFILNGTTAFGNNLSGNTAYDARQQYGFYVVSTITTATNNTFWQNNATNNSYAGFFVLNAKNITFYQNNASNNTLAGFLINTSTAINLSANRAFGLGQRNGFQFVSNAENASINDNLAYNNTAHGFLVNGSANATLSNNTALNNTLYGFYIQTSANSTIANGTAANNSIGFYVENTLFSNGKAVNLTQVNATNNSQYGFYIHNSSAFINAANASGNPYVNYFITNSSNVTFLNDVLSLYTGIGTPTGWDLNISVNATATTLYGGVLRNFTMQFLVTMFDNATNVSLKAMNHTTAGYTLSGANSIDSCGPNEGNASCYLLSGNNMTNITTNSGSGRIDLGIYYNTTKRSAIPIDFSRLFIAKNDTNGWVRVGQGSRDTNAGWIFYSGITSFSLFSVIGVAPNQTGIGFVSSGSGDSPHPPPEEPVAEPTPAPTPAPQEEPAMQNETSPTAPQNETIVEPEMNVTQNETTPVIVQNETVNVTEQPQIQECEITAGEGTSGESQSISASSNGQPCSNVEVTIVTPKGEEIKLVTDEKGNTEFTPEEKGDYNITLVGADKKPVKAVAIKVKAKITLDEILKRPAVILEDPVLAGASAAVIVSIGYGAYYYLFRIRSLKMYQRFKK